MRGEFKGRGPPACPGQPLHQGLSRGPPGVPVLPVSLWPGGSPGARWGLLLWGTLLTPGTGAEPRRLLLNPESIVTFLGCLAQKPRLSQRLSCPH